MTHLLAGDKAPDFTGKDQNGKKISLKGYRGKKVVLYFYPQDDTPTCTVEACNLRDNYSDLIKAGFAVIGVSPDDGNSHKKFEKKYELPFTLVEDSDKTIINKYAVWGEKNNYGKKYMGLIRTTFLIDEKGIIFKIFKKPKSKIHSEEILKALEN
jgi:peroxiredoxin Q/BCP